MSMALKHDVREIERQTGQNKPIDLVHLGKQTFGDPELEQEVLGIFSTQARIYFNMISKSCDVTTRIRAAHSLKGAALAIGAVDLAEFAAELEKVDNRGACALEAELDQVLGYINQLYPHADIAS